MTAHWSTTDSSLTAISLSNGKHIAYGDLDSAGFQLTQELQRDDLVALECRNNLSTVALLRGVLQRGIPTLLVDAQLPKNLRESLYQRFSISAVFNSSEDRWTRLQPKGPKVHSDLQLLLSTSGSTGAPKLVRLSKSNLLANAQQIAAYLPLDSKSRAITVLPFHYSFGLSVLLTHWKANGSIALTDHSIVERSFWDFLEASRADSIAGVPLTFEQLKRLRLANRNLPSLRTLIQAGGKLRKELALEFAELSKEKNWRFFMMYGQTEATARMAYLTPDLAALKPDSIGRPVTGGSFELQDSSDNLITLPGTTGELIYRGPNVMMGYAETASDLAKGDELNGILRTGDLAHFDSEGDFTIVGRLSRFIKIYGTRVGLDHLENWLISQGCHIALTGEDDFLLVAATSQQDADIVKEKLTEQFPLPKRVLHSMILPQFPTGTQGKIQYAEILKLYKEKKQTGAPK